jgi:hypothetical protein
MAWYAVSVRFTSQPGEEPWEHFLEWLEFPDLDSAGDRGGADPVAPTLTVEADDAAGARALLLRALAEVGGLPDAELGEPAETVDPRLPSQTVLKLLARAEESLDASLAEDAELLREGGKPSEMFTLDSVFPPCYTPGYTAEFVERFRQAAAQARRQLAAYPEGYLACTAEELAGHALVAVAKDFAKDDLVGADRAAALEKLDEIHELAYADWDVLMLFDASLDGLEEGPIAERMGFANLKLADWFEPFRDDRGTVDY